MLSKQVEGSPSINEDRNVSATERVSMFVFVADSQDAMPWTSGMNATWVDPVPCGIPVRDNA